MRAHSSKAKLVLGAPWQAVLAFPIDVVPVPEVAERARLPSPERGLGRTGRRLASWVMPRAVGGLMLTQILAWREDSSH